MDRFKRLILSAAATVAVAASPASGAFAAALCPPSHMPPLTLTQSRKMIDSGKELVIVALGSSSTQGNMATSMAATYPAQLQADLRQMFPKSHVAVLNRGIGGQDAPEELARLEADAIAVRPSLIIWQVGANGAMSRADPEVFRSLVTTGLTKIREAGIDVILMDNQRSPMILSSPTHGTMDAILMELASKFNVGLFSRGALMDEWKKQGAPYEEFVSGDMVHHNDLGYRCVAAALASSMAQGLATPKPDSGRIAIATRPNG